MRYLLQHRLTYLIYLMVGYGYLTDRIARELITRWAYNDGGAYIVGILLALIASMLAIPLAIYLVQSVQDHSIVYLEWITHTRPGESGLFDATLYVAWAATLPVVLFILIGNYFNQASSERDDGGPARH